MINFSMTQSGYYIAHRINSVSQLKEIPDDVGVEIDIRFDNRCNSIYLNHDNGSGESLENYLENFVWNERRVVVFNIKDSGTEQACIDLAKRFTIPPSHYFLLDCEFPYIYSATKKGIQEIALRFSEAEPIEQALLFSPTLPHPSVGRVKWLWIDTNSTLPLNRDIWAKIQAAGFRTCLVCPERWGRPEDIELYAELLRRDEIQLDAVMTHWTLIDRWKMTGVISSPIGTVDD